MDSSRPIMAPSLASNRVSKRYSAVSGSVASFASSEDNMSTSTTNTRGDPRMQEIREYSNGVEKLNSSRLQQQRYAPSAEKSDDLAKLALGAKIDRALDRRFSSQDAIMRPKNRTLSEKQG